MGHLLLINDSFEMAFIQENDRDRIFINFCKAIDLTKLHEDTIYANNDFFIRRYSYGTFYDFIYKSWPEIVRDEHLKGISNTAHQLYSSLIQAVPGLARRVGSVDEYLSSYSKQHFGFYGFEMKKLVNRPYICCEGTWHRWKSNWFIKHQNEINWKKANDEFLPNKNFSNNIIEDETHNHNVQNKITQYNGSIVNTFYEEVMKKKGSEIEAYTIKIGRKILELNYYVYDKELSKREKKLAKGSLRNIYKLLLRNGNYSYISLDHRHGMFEYHDHKGTHLGEYRFDGSYNSTADSTHDLKTLKNN
ncbi:MAG: hypothetical protein V1720_01380 [bacterium]